MLFSETAVGSNGQYQFDVTRTADGLWHVQAGNEAITHAANVRLAEACVFGIHRELFREFFKRIAPDAQRAAEGAWTPLVRMAYSPGAAMHTATLAGTETVGVGVTPRAAVEDALAQARDAANAQMTEPGLAANRKATVILDIADRLEVPPRALDR